MALEVGEFQKAVEYARAALLMDLADVGGNVTDVCHIASMGGTWMIFTYGFAGFRDCDGRLSFRPQRPEPQASVRFALTYHGQELGVEIDPVSTTHSLRSGNELTSRHGEEEIVLHSVVGPVTASMPSEIRPARKPFWQDHESRTLRNSSRHLV